MHGHEGPRWIPVAAAVLAVLAALSGFVSNLRATAAVIEKNDAIVAVSRAADTWSEYEAERIKYYVYQSQIDGGNERPKLRQTAAREAKKSPPIAARARAYEHDADEHNRASEHVLAQHETLEVATTLFEVAIVVVSISALVGSRLLHIVAAVAAAIGLAVFFAGLLI